MKQKITIGLAEDSTCQRRKIEHLLNYSGTFELVNIAEHGQQLIDQILDNTIPEVILMDIRMPVLNGISATSIIKNKYPQIKIIAYTLNDSEELINQMFEAGASAFLYKTTPNEYQLELIEKVVNNTFSQNFDIYSELFLEYKSINQKEVFKLTPKESVILNMICEGKTNSEIAGLLELKIGTVNAYRNHLLFKTKSKNSIELALKAVKYGLYNG